MSKRSADDETVSQIKKLKLVKDEQVRDDNGMIDLELLSHQTNYQQEALSTEKAIEDLNKYREGGFEYLIKGSQAQREAQAQAIQAQAVAQYEERPMAGTEEWRKLRKDNHKEVERRRREHINAGIKALSALLPTTETNKAQILQRAVEYIKRLKDNESSNIEKWTLEKLLTEQAVAELNLNNEKLKQELEKTYKELERYKRMVEEKNSK